MRKYNAANERIKHHYRGFLKEAHRKSEKSVDAFDDAVARFEVYTRYRDFKLFHVRQAVGFKRHLATQTNRRTGTGLSHATCHAILGHLKRFFVWLAGQPGFRSRISYSDADYFNLSEKESRIATARRDAASPTLEEIRSVIKTMPHRTEIERRDRAVVAFTLLTGSRDGAIASLKLKHVDLSADRVDHDAREVQTKNSKTFATFFFPVGEDIRRILEEWVSYQRDERRASPDDPLFPATNTTLDQDGQYCANGLKPEHWRTSTPIRRIFKTACAAAGLAYFNPHSVRKTLVALGQNRCHTPEDFKAWSQNLGHEQVMTTFSSYGAVRATRQAEIMRELARPTRVALSGDADVRELMRRLTDQLSRDANL
jgi:integrase/recombinase XerD